MKQQVTQYQKSTAKQFAYLFLGVGLIGLALSVGENFGFVPVLTANLIMIGGFALATIFLFISGGELVVAGTELTDVDSGLNLDLSDEANRAIQSKMEAAIAEMVENHKYTLGQLSKTADEMAQKIASVQATLERANVSAIADNLSNLSSAIDIKATNAALGSLKGNMGNVLASLDELSKVTMAGSKKLGSVMTDFEQVQEKSKRISTELDKTLRSISAFNSRQ